MLIHKVFAFGFFVVSLLPAQVVFERADGKIDIQIDGKPFSTFYFGPETTKPYLHPLRAADGTIVSRGFPMERIDGESDDHPHHRGLWFSHGDVNGFDFWLNEVSQRTERTGAIALQEIRRADAGRIEAVFAWKAPDGTVVVTEERAMTFHAGSPNRVVDLDIRLIAGSQAVKFGDTKEGAFALRLATQFEEPRRLKPGEAAAPEPLPRGGKMRNAEGKVGESQIWGKPSPWVGYSATIGGKPFGVAFFDHPQNPKHPTFWHARGYGLFAANPFGEHDFFADPSRDGSITVPPGGTLRFRYRVLIHPGDTAQAKVGELYRAYAQEAR